MDLPTGMGKMADGGGPEIGDGGIGEVGGMGYGDDVVEELVRDGGMDTY